MASPTLTGVQTLVETAATTDRTLTAPTGIANGDKALVLFGWNASKPSITFGWTGTAGSGDWAEGPTADKTASTDWLDSWFGTLDTSNANFWKVHTSGNRAIVWVAGKLAGADVLANWTSEAHTTGAGSAVQIGLSTLATTSDRLLVALVVGPSGAADPTSLPDSWTQISSGTSVGTGAAYFLVATRPAAANETPADQTFTFTGTSGAWETMVVSIPASAGTATLDLTGSRGSAGNTGRFGTLTLGSAVLAKTGARGSGGGTARFGALTKVAASVFQLNGVPGAGAGAALRGRLEMEFADTGPGPSGNTGSVGALTTLSAAVTLAGSRAAAGGSARFGTLAEDTVGHVTYQATDAPSGDAGVVGHLSYALSTTRIGAAGTSGRVGAIRTSLPIDISISVDLTDRDQWSFGRADS